MTWLTCMEYMCHSDNRYVPFVVNTSWSFLHSRLIIGFVTTLARRVQLVELDQQALLKNLDSTIRISKNKQHNGQKKNVQKEKQPSTKHTYKANVRVTRIPLKTGLNPGSSEGPADPVPLVVPVVLM
jgi:hypothetical protein